MRTIVNRNLQVVRNKAYNMHIDGIITISKKKGKRFDITRPDGKVISFGLWKPVIGTYIDHLDEKTKEAWQARHSKILKNGYPAYKNPDSPEYYSWHLLWT
jgi:hypothetical protein